jgi:hypothetical protein
MSSVRALLPESANSFLRNKSDEITWTVAATGVAFAAAAVTHNVLKFGWTGIMGEPPPQNPASPDTTWRDALLWGALTGVLVGVARIAAHRGAAGAYHQWKGHYPPGLRATTR